jgi:MoxR-like ATPase
MRTMPFESIADVKAKLASAGYLASDAIATTVFLASELGKPLLVEGPAGVGKTALSSAVAESCGADLVRLQCYEGVDEARALYEWNHAKQLLRITAGHGETWDEARDDIFSEEFLLARPLLTAIRNENPTVLLSSR